MTRCMCSCICGRNGFLNSCCVIGALIGFTNIGDVNSHLAAYEEAVEGGEQPEVRLANSIARAIQYPAIPICAVSML